VSILHDSARQDDVKATATRSGWSGYDAAVADLAAVKASLVDELRWWADHGRWLSFAAGRSRKVAQ
jgi:hypothetical protein